MQFAAVIERMLAKGRNDRLGTPSDVATALQPFAANANLPRLLS
jgi:hypothetical protein